MTEPTLARAESVGLDVAARVCYDPVMIVYATQWIESERGWGQRPDGFSLHLTKQNADEYIKAYWDSMPDAVPDEYSAPGEPREIELDVPEEWLGQLQHGSLGVRVYQHKAHLKIEAGKKAEVVYREW